MCIKPSWWITGIGPGSAGWLGCFLPAAITTSRLALDDRPFSRGFLPFALLIGYLVITAIASVVKLGAERRGRSPVSEPPRQLVVGSQIGVAVIAAAFVLALFVGPVGPGIVVTGICLWVGHGWRRYELRTGERQLATQPQ